MPDNQEGGCSEEEALPLHRILFLVSKVKILKNFANLPTLIWILFIVELPTLMGEKWRAASRWIGVCCLIATCDNLEIENCNEEDKPRKLQQGKFLFTQLLPSVLKLNEG